MRIAIVTPVFNDWASLSHLIGALEVAEVSKDVSFSVFVVDDGSSEHGTIEYPLLWTSQGRTSCRLCGQAHAKRYDLRLQKWVYVPGGTTSMPCISPDKN
jgi:hypothetical protein